MRFWILLLMASCGNAVAFFDLGSLLVRIAELTSPFREKTISNTYHESALGTGQLVANVNAFNGMAAYSISLGNVDLRGKLTWPIDLSYGGNTRLIVDADNHVSPSGWVGLGWGLAIPYVAINHKGTFASSDDLIYVSLGKEGGGQLLQKNGRFFIANNPFIKVSAKTASTGDLSGQFEEWTFELPSGVKYVFGQADQAVSNSERIVYYTGSFVQVSPFTLSAAKPFIYRWDLRKIEDPEGANRIQFKYRSFTAPVFPGSARQYTKEAYIDTISWTDRLGNPVEQFAFVLGSKTAQEWVDDDAFSPRTQQQPVESHFLDRIVCLETGRVSHEIRLGYSLVGTGKYVKRLLTSVQGFHNHPTSAMVQPLHPAHPWLMTYEGVDKHYMLNSVTKPSGAQDAFQYRAFSADDFFPYGMQSPSDDTMKTLASGTLQPVVVPSDQDARDKWQNAAQCDEFFCYSTVVTDNAGANGQRLYAEIRHNTGNYFDTARVARLHGISDGTPNDWAFYPVGDYVALANHIQGRVFPFAWNGVGFDTLTLDPGPVDNPSGLPGFFGNPTGTSDGISFLPGANFMVVHKHGNRNKTWFFVRDGSGPGGQGFRRLNQTASACDIDNSNAFGETVKDAGDGCLEWKGSDNVQAYLGQKIVTLVHDPTDIIFAYAENKTGTGFQDLSGSFLPFDNSIHLSSFPNNWQHNIEDIRHGPDYFVVKSKEGDQGRFDVMHFDGTFIRRVAFSGWHADGAGEKLMVFPADDYFIEANHTTRQIVYWKKRVSADGLSLLFEPHVVRSDWDADAMDLRVHTFPNAFTLEYFANNSVSNSGRPLRETAVPAGTCTLPSGQAEDFRSYLYQITRDLPQEFVDRSPDLRLSIGGCTTKMYDVAFSGSDNFLDGLTAREPGNAGAACTETNSFCDIYRRTAKIRMLASPSEGYLYSQEGVDLPDFGSTRSRQDLFAEAARLGMSSAISEPKLRILQRFYAYDGRDFEGAPDNLFYVEKSLQRDGVNQELATGFASDIREYNCYSQSPMFESATISPLGDRPMGRVEIGFNLDLADAPLVDRRLKLNGVAKFQRNLDASGALISVSVPAYLDEASLAASFPPEWPEAISINRQVSQTNILAKGPGLRISTDSMLVYDNKNGQTHFTKSLRSGRWHLSQSIFTDTGVVKQNIDYVYPFNPAQPNGPSVASAPLATPFDPLHAIASVKNQYDPAFPFILQTDSLWRDADPTLTDADLRTGREPVFDLTRGWTAKDQTSIRNAELQPLELKAYRGGAAPITTSVFYEGRRASPVGKVFNSSLANCAVLMGENGDVPGAAGLDWQGRWEKPGTSFSTDQAHTGTYSLKVVDNYGPTINLFLENVRQDNVGFLASAWFYAGAGITPQFKVERRTAAGNLVDAFSATPVGGTKIDGRWQRWEVRLTPAQLIAGGLFNGNRDFLRIWGGTGAPAGNTGRILYADDFVLRPDRADFALTTYNFQGKPVSQTDSQHSIHTNEFDFLGMVTGIRDDRYRLLSQSAQHAIGEDN